MSGKTDDQHWIDWESHAFGFGYGTGEPHIIPALKKFFQLTPLEGGYDYEIIEKELGSVVAWLFINRLCGHGIGIIEYGTSPRYGWLTETGNRLRKYITSQTTELLIELVCDHNDDHIICYPDACNCGPKGYQAGVLCPNPFWRDKIDEALK